LKEARAAYGDEQRLALILSLGSGLPPAISLESSTSLSKSIENLVKYIAVDCERVARELSSQLIEVDVYVRLNVARGLEDVLFNEWSKMGLIEDYTKTYLEAAPVAQILSKVTEKITRQVGAITLGQISEPRFVSFRSFY
jgi:hypothetical protein